MTRKDRKARAGALSKGTGPVLSYFFRFTMLSTLECLLSSKEKKMVQIGFVKIRSESSFLPL